MTPTNKTTNASPEFPGDLELLKNTAKRQIGRLLFDAGVITQLQFDEAHEVQEKKGGEIIDILFSLDSITPDSFLDFLLTYPGLGPAITPHLEISADLIDLIPTEIAREHQIIPIDQAGQVLTLGTVALLDGNVVRHIEGLTGLQIKTLLCKCEDVQAAIVRYYGTEDGSDEQTNPESQEFLKGLHEPLRLSHVAHLVRRIKSLPALPETVLHVREAMGNPDSSVSTMVDIITLDPPIAAKVLSVANSAAYGFSHRIHDLNLAVSLLGLRETYAIVLSASVVDLVSRFERFDYRAFFLQAVCCATAARIVAKACGRRNLVGVFTAGLLHDIGHAALWEVEPQLCRKIEGDLSGQALVDAEVQALGISHAEAGYELATHWNLPHEIAESIRLHHAPTQASRAPEHVAIIALADAMVQVAGTSLEENPGIFEELRESMDLLGLDDEIAEAMLDEFLTKFETALGDAFI
jgi:HD-like signal output (HDOD) protein